MATRIQKLPLESGGHVLVELYEIDQGAQRVGVGETAAKTFEAAWDNVMPVIQSLSVRLAKCGPTEAQIKFGVKIATGVNVVIAGANGEATFDVTLTWKPPQK
jgi:Trypsin-co-occurring domain 1